MKPYIKERTLEVAEHVLQTGDTVRATAKWFNISKSTVHNDLSKRLKAIDFVLFERVQQVLDKNFAEKHIRGGMSTKDKYQKNNKIKNCKKNNKKFKKSEK